MPQLVRSAKGELVDFELLAIKQQLAASPVPKVVEARKQAIAEKDGVKADPAPDIDFSTVPPEPTISGQAKQLRRK